MRTIWKDLLEAHRTVNKYTNEVKALARGCIEDLNAEMVLALEKEEEGYDYVPKFQEIIHSYGVTSEAEYSYSVSEFEKLVEALTLIETASLS